MIDFLGALALGACAGGLGISSRRFPILGWVSLAPLGAALASGTSAQAAAAAALAGALINSREIADSTMRRFGIISCVMSALTWGLSFALAAWLMPSAPEWIAVKLPLATLLAHLPVRFAGAPRWHANPLASAQEPWLSVVHTARMGGDLTPTLLLSVFSAGSAMLLLELPPSKTILAAALACFGLVAVALLLGRRSLDRATLAADSSSTVRVAAVVANAPPPTMDEYRATWPLESPDYKDVEATVERYRPHILSAANQGAQLIVLPELALNGDEDSLRRWLDAASVWAKQHAVTLIVPYLDGVRPKNELRIIGPDGKIVSRYEKQHPIAHLEGKREQRQSPNQWSLPAGERRVPLSTVLCVDLDYADLCRPVRQAGGILAVPANDWPNFDEVHHRAAVWAAVITGVSIVRSTGWGISAVFDGAGRVLARASSVRQPAVVVADVPVAGV